MIRGSAHVKATERSLGVALGLATLAVLALTALAFRTTDDFARSADMAARAMEVRGVLADVLTSMEQGETGERGFVISGDERFLEPFNVGVGNIPVSLARLQILVRGDAEAEASLHELTALIDRAFDFQRGVIEARRNGVAAEAAALVMSGQGKLRSDAVRAQISTMRDRQRGRVQERLAGLPSRHRTVLGALAGFTVLTLVLVGAVYLALRRDTRVRRAERKFRGLVECAPDGIILVDAHGRITLANARTEALLGYGRNELVGQLIEILVPEGVRARHPRLRTSYATSPRTRPMGAGLSLFARRKDGSEMPVEISLSPLETEEGVLTCAVVRDVTERWCADLALREAREAADSIVETIREPLVVLDTELRVVRANEAFYRRFGETPARIERRRLSEIGAGEWCVPGLQGQLAQVVAGTLAEFHDLEIEREWMSLGGLRTMRLGARPIQRAGARSAHILLAIEDVTEHKRAVQFLLERETLERANRELQEFTYVASHDLQEPLRKIQAFGDRLGKGYAASLPSEAADFVERMQNAATRMRRLIDDLLAFSRVTTRAQSFAPVDLGVVAREVLTDLEVRIEQSGGRVELGALPTIDADASQVRQLLQNLVANALKFHRPEVPPVVAVRARLLEPKRREASFPLCQIEIEDNGIGFEEKYLDRIFTIFQRLHGRNAFEGTGLGLAICRKIVERHRGFITARSVVGSGSTFIVTLPTRQPDDLGKERETHEGIADELHAADGR